jgi:hypothetical protein
MRNPSLIYDEGGNVIGASPDKQPPLVIPPEMRNLPNATPAQAPLVMPKEQLPTEGQTIPGQANAPLNVPKSLQNALGTTRSPVSTQAPVARQSKPNALPAAGVQPQVSGVPTAEDLIARPEAAYANLTKQGVGALGDERERLLELNRLQKQQEAETELLKAQNTERQQKEYNDSVTAINNREKNDIEQTKQNITQTSPFAPTKENAKDVAGLFALMSVAAFGSGGKGKYSGMQALASLTGAMKGYQAGRQDVYEKDIKNFEENMKANKQHNEELLKMLELAQKEYSKDRDNAQLLLNQAIAHDSTGIATRLARSGNISGAIDAVKMVISVHETMEQRIHKLQDDKTKIGYEIEKYKAIHPTAASYSGMSLRQIFDDNAHAIASYAMNPRDIPIKERGALLAEARKINPSYNEGDYSNRNKAVGYWQIGKGSQQLQSFKTVQGHLDSMNKLIDALQNNDIKAANKVYNFFRTQLGDTNVTNFDTAKQVVANEVVRAISAVGGTSALADRQEAARIFDAAKSPAMLKESIGVLQDLISSKVDTARGFYQTATGRDDFDKLIAPTTVSTLATTTTASSALTKEEAAELAALKAKHGK